MQFTQPFDARGVEPVSFPAPPVLADYHVRICESEGKATKDGTGGYLELMLEILDPAYMGRKIPYVLNLFNTNPQTVEIAYKQLSAVCHVTGQFNIADSRQLHGIPFIATIGPQEKNPTYTKVFAVKDLNGNTPGKASAPAPVAPLPPAPPIATAQPAWAPPGQPTQPPTQAWQPPASAPAPAPTTQQPWQAPAPAQAPPVATWQPPAWAPSGAPPSGKAPWEK